MQQMELLKEIGELNKDGISVLYVDQAGKPANEFFEDYILWDQDAKTLKHALSTPIKYKEKPLIMVDTDKTLMGFYVVGDDEGGKIRLDLQFKFYFKELKNLPSAPQRPLGRKVQGQSLDKDQLDTYIYRVKCFLG